MDRYEQDHDLTELNIDLSLDDILFEYQGDIPAAPSPAAEPEEDPDDGFFRIAGESAMNTRQEVPKHQQPIPDAEHFWDLPGTPVQETPASDETYFPDLSGAPAAKQPAAEPEQPSEEKTSE